MDDCGFAAASHSMRFSRIGCELRRGVDSEVQRDGPGAARLYLTDGAEELYSDSASKLSDGIGRIFDAMTGCPTIRFVAGGTPIDMASRLPLTGRDQPLDHSPKLVGGDGRGIVGGPEPDHVQDLRPRSTVRCQRGDEGVRPTRDDLRGLPRTAVDVTEQSLRRAGRVRAQPRGDVHGEHDPPVKARHRQGNQQVTRGVGVDPAMVQRCPCRKPHPPWWGEVLRVSRNLGRGSSNWRSRAAAIRAS